MSGRSGRCLGAEGISPSWRDRTAATNRRTRPAEAPQPRGQAQAKPARGEPNSPRGRCPDRLEAFPRVRFSRAKSGRELPEKGGRHRGLLAEQLLESRPADRQAHDRSARHDGGGAWTAVQERHLPEEAPDAARDRGQAPPPDGDLAVEHDVERVARLAGLDDRRPLLEAPDPAQVGDLVQVATAESGEERDLHQIVRPPRASDSPADRSPGLGIIGHVSRRRVDALRSPHKRPHRYFVDGAYRDRTDDPRLAKRYGNRVESRGVGEMPAKRRLRPERTVSYPGRLLSLLLPLLLSPCALAGRTFGQGATAAALD